MTLLLALAATLPLPLPIQDPPGREVTVDRGVYDPAVSPDGSTLAFGLLGSIWLLPAEGGEARRLTEPGGWDHHPAWSPDGERLAYVHDTPEASDAGSRIVLRSLDTGEARGLHGRSPTSGPHRAVFPFGKLGFHPTNGRLYFVDFRSGIGSIDPAVEAPQPEKLLPGSERIGRPGISEGSSFAFIPDGDSIVVVVDTPELWTQLHRTALGAVELSEVTPRDKIKRTDVAWSPALGALVYLELFGGAERIALQDPDSGQVRRIELGPFNGRQLALFPGGEQALVVSERRLFRVDLVSGELASIPFQAKVALPPRPAGDLVIANARLFDGTGADVVERAAVHIRGGVIAEVVAGAEIPEVPGVRVIDARGRLLLPGLVDAHSHFEGLTRFSMARIPARGVTSVFDPGSHLPETLNARDAIELGVFAGPRMYTSGPTIDGPKGRARSLTLANVTDPDDARALISSLADQGVDAIKTYAFLEPEITAVVIEAAHARGLPVVGDLVETSWESALDAGIDGFIHVMDHKWRFISDQETDPDDPWAVVDPSAERMDAFFARVAERGAMFDPTMMASSRTFDSKVFLAALHEGVGEPEVLHRTKVLTELLGSMHRQGVTWVAGTDTDPSDLLDELAIYEAMGIPNDVILRTATANVARWLRKDDFGTVEPGKRADLILVDGDPLERIRDLERVMLVIQEGRVVVER